MKRSLNMPFRPEEIRRQTRLANWLYWPAVLLLVLAGILAGLAILLDPFTYTRQFDPVRQHFVYSTNSSVQTLFTAALFGSIGLGVLSIILHIAGSIAFLILLYRCWSVIQDGQARASPAAAVGLLFVPLFNIYWIHAAFVGLANGLNKFIRRHQVPAPLACPALPRTFCIYQWIGLIPFLGVPAMLVNLFYFPLMISSLGRVAADLVDAWPDRGEDSDGEFALPRVTLWFNLAVVVAPIGVALTSIGLLIGGLNVSDLIHSVHSHRSNSQELAHFQVNPPVDAQTRKRVQILQTVVDSQSQRRIPELRQRSLLGVGLTIAGSLTTIAAAALACLHWPAAPARNDGET